jgi:hypothetical protein
LTTKYNYDHIDRSQAAVREAYLALEGKVNKVGLKNNESNTKYLNAGRNSRTTFEVVTEFVYLGSLVTPNNDLSLEIKKRIQKCKTILLVAES